MKEVQPNSYVNLKEFTPWQKEWFIENANFLSPCSESQVKSGLHRYVLFKKWGDCVLKWGTSDPCYIVNSNKLSFNDLYEGEELDEPTPSTPPVKSTPKWVTFNANQDMLDVWYGILEDGKDYKVEYAVNDCYFILVEGVLKLVHKSFFHEVIKEDLLQKKVVGTESFDNLVRSEYVFQEGDYFVLDKLSEEQKEFLTEVLPITGKGTFYWRGGFARYYDDDKDFGGDVTCADHEIFFNDLFVEKDN